MLDVRWGMGDGGLASRVAGEQKISGFRGPYSTGDFTYNQLFFENKKTWGALSGYMPRL